MDNDDTADSQRCPACEAPTRHSFRPFCSRRCKDLDLGRWLRGSYRIPTEEAPAEGPSEKDDDDDNPFGGRA